MTPSIAVSSAPTLSPARRAVADRLLAGTTPVAPVFRCSPRPAHTPIPLTDTQLRIWLLTQLAPDSTFYNECYTVRLPDALDISALERSLTAIVHRHAIWRTTFEAIDGEPRQIVHPPAPFAVAVVDLRSVPEAERAAEALRLASADAAQPFELARGPLLRAMVVSLNDAEHKLFLTIHHLVVDGLSLYRVFLPELAHLYSAYARGETPSLPDLPVQYADYACWRHEQIRNVTADQLAYWARQLSAPLPHLELPTDRPRPARITFRGERVQSILSAEFRTRVAAAAAAHGATPFMWLLTAFVAQLHRLNGQDDLIVGVPIATTRPVACERLIGLFANTVALRIDVSGNPSFRTLLRRVRDAVLDATDHADVPFERVVENARPSRDSGHTPLFQAMFTIQEGAPAVVSAHGFEVAALEADAGGTKVDIGLLLDERHSVDAQGRRTTVFGATLQGSTDLFESPTMGRRLEEFEILTRNALDDPGCRLSELSLLTARQRHTMLVSWNETTRPYPRHVPVHKLFEAQAARTPDAAALECGSTRLSYGELDARANRLAIRLQRRGVGRGTRVGLALQRSASFVVAALATLKAGGVYVPLDLHAPDERLAFVVADAGAQVIVSEGSSFDSRLASKADIIRLEELASGAIDRDTRLEPLDVGGDDLACVLYTSGSTGRPKGVAIAHRGIARLVTNTDYIALGSGDRVAHLSNVCFDASTFEMWGALTSGAELVVIPHDVVLSPQALADSISGGRITSILLTTSLFNLVALERPSAFRSVRDVLFGGESADATAVRRVLDVGPPQRLLNVYGPTEATTLASWHRINESGGLSGTVPIGRPIANTTIYILDAMLAPVPVGVPGELYIGGDGVAHGYVNSPDLTAERFVPDPFASVAGARLYRTGDLARYRADGTIEFVGRVDNQVKIRGFRIEPGEIECALAKHADVTASAVVARTSPTGDKQLVAYVTVTGKLAADGHVPAALRAFLKQTLPEYMVPAAIVTVDEWPLTATGKINRRALPSVSLETTATAPGTAARKPWEHEVVALWEELLNVRPIGTDDNFFDLGGHSLLAARMVEELDRRSGYRLPLASLFLDPTVKAIAHAVAGHREIVTGPVVALKPQGRRPPIFFFHGDFTGGGLFCRRLAAAIDDRPFYVVQPHGMDGRRIPTTIEAMAEDRIAVLRAERPHGPYALGGYCNGALVALEIARRLIEEGECVERLVFVDPPPAADRGLRLLKTLATDWLSIDRVRLGRWYCRMRDFCALSLTAKWRVMRRWSGLSAGVPHPEVPSADSTAVRYDPTHDYCLAVRTYVPPDAAPPISVIVSEHESALIDPRWRCESKSVKVVPTRGDHTTCITTHASTLAERFRECFT